MISKDDIAKVVKGQDSMYKACIANGYFMAPRNSPINTSKFMIELYNGTVILPKSNDVRNFNVLHPPTRDDLIEMIANMIENHGNYDTEEVCQAWNRLAMYLRKCKPEKQWLLGLLNFFNPDHEVFTKGYKPPNALQQNERVQPMFENRNGFFSDLDELSLKEMKRKGGISLMSKK